MECKISESLSSMIRSDSLCVKYNKTHTADVPNYLWRSSKRIWNHLFYLVFIYMTTAREIPCARYIDIQKKENFIIYYFMMVSWWSPTAFGRGQTQIKSLSFQNNFFFCCSVSTFYLQGVHSEPGQKMEIKWWTVSAPCTSQGLCCSTTCGHHYQEQHHLEPVKSQKPINWNL